MSVKKDYIIQNTVLKCKKTTGVVQVRGQGQEVILLDVLSRLYTLTPQVLITSVNRAGFLGIENIIPMKEKANEPVKS